MLKKRLLLIYLLNYSVWIILALFIGINAILTPRFLSILNFKNILVQSSVLGIIVIGESLCLISGNFDLSVGSVLALSAVIGALLVSYNVPTIVAIAAMLGTGATIGLFNGFLIRKVGMNAFIATLISFLGARGIALGIVKGRTIWNLPSSFRIFGDQYIFNVPIQIITMISLYLLFHFLLSNTRFGRHLYLTGDNEVAAYSSGINVDRIVIAAFILSGLLSAFAGLTLAGRLNSSSPVFGEGMVFEAMAAAIIGGISLKGGIGKLPMALGGVLLLGAIGNVLNLHAISPYWIKAIRGGLILVAVLLDVTKRRVITYEGS